jgi:hypothetical protein
MEILIVVGGILVFALGAGIVWTGFPRRRLRVVAENHGWTYHRTGSVQRSVMVTRRTHYGVRGPQWTYAITTARPTAQGAVAFRVGQRHTRPRRVQTMWITDQGGTPGIVLAKPLLWGQSDPFDNPVTNRVSDPQALLDAAVHMLLHTTGSHGLQRSDAAAIPGYVVYSVDPAQGIAASARITAAFSPAWDGDSWLHRPTILLHPGGVILTVDAAITDAARVERLIALGAAIAGL